MGVPRGQRQLCKAMKKAGGPLGGVFVQAMSGQRSGLNIQRNELSDVFYVRSLVFIELHVQPKTVGLMFTIIIISVFLFFGGCCCSLLWELLWRHLGETQTAG